MIIDSKKFSELINKANFVTTSHGGAILDFEETEAKISCIDATIACYAEFTLPKSEFVNYEPLGQIGIKSLETVLKALDRLKGDVIIEIQGKRLVLKTSSKEIDLTLAASDFIVVPKPKLLSGLNYVDMVFIPKAALKEVLNDLKLFNKEVFMNLRAKLDTITFSIGKQDTIVSSYKDSSICITESYNIRIQREFFEKLIDVLTDEKVRLYIGHDMPLKITETNSTYYIMPANED